MDKIISIIENNLKLPNGEGLDSIQEEIQLLFNKIKQTEKIEEANSLFSKLEEIQYVLAKAVFKDKLNVTPFLREFIYDFDRIDDNDVKKYQYNKIKLD